MLNLQIILEVYGPTIKYIRGPDNDTVDALSRLPLINSLVTESEIKREDLSESYCVKKMDGNTFQLIYQKIDKYQWKYK